MSISLESSLLIHMSRKIQQLELIVEQLRDELKEERTHRREAEESERTLRFDYTKLYLKHHFPTHNHWQK